MIGQTVGHYLIIEEIGAGGMGVVYRARDERLNRDVALKVLHAGKLGDQAPRKRFRKEALALAKLNHPNIGTVYDFDTQDDVDFLVMEYIRGETLGQRIANGSLPEKEVVALGLQIAAALEEAHEHNIVHQDLKPGNIMVTPKGQAKVLDFGLARLLEAAGDGAQTLTQNDVGGTLPYMAPEQLRNERVDARTDIYAAGVVFYEMATGQRPFKERLSALLIQQILAEAPPSPSGLNRRISAQLESTVLKALDKQPDLRYQSARELRVDLERLGAQHTASSVLPAAPRPGTWRRLQLAARAHPRTIGLCALILVMLVASLWWFAGTRPVLSFAPRDSVLITDFDNQTGDPLFDRSLFTALTVSMEQSPHANVVSRARIAESLRRMGKAGDEKINEDVAREISQRENFRVVLSCAIGRVGQQYALTVRLIDPQSSATVRSYIEQAKDQNHILDALGSIATRIRHDLGESLLATRKTDRPLPQVTTRSLQALKMYADGRALWGKAQYDQAVQLYNTALQADPDFAMAHALLGGALYSHIYNNRAGGKVHFEKALQLSGRTTDRERLYIQTSYAHTLGHVDEATRLYSLYLTSYPDDWGMRFSFANLLRSNDRAEEALQQYKEVLRLSPNNAFTYIDIATTYRGMGSFTEALHNYEQAFKLEPGLVTSQNLNHEYGMTVFQAGDEAKAREVFALAVAKPDLKPRGLRSLAWLDLYRGKYAAAKPRLQEALLLDTVQKWDLSILREHNLLAIVAEGQGDRTGCFRELALAVPFLPAVGPKLSAGLWLGMQYVRCGNAAKAAEILEKVQPEADLNSPEQASDLHVLQAEVELGRGNRDRAIELFLFGDKQKSSAMTVEGLARAYEAKGNLEQAIAWYEKLLSAKSPPLGWEQQQDWIAAHYHLAKIYFAKGDKAKAASQLDWLLNAWKEADPELPLLKDAVRLRKEIESKP